MRLDAAIWVLAGVTTLAATQPEISEWAALAFSVAGGLSGGFVASGLSDAPLARGGIAARVVASGMIAPALVLGAVTHMAGDGVVIYRALPVAAASGLAGLIAWPAASILHNGLALIRASEVADWLRGLIPGFRRGGDE